MNILAIDAGNSRIKWGLAEDSGWLRRGVVDTRDVQALQPSLGGLPMPDMVIAANVAGAAVADSITAALPRAPRWIRPCTEQCGVRNGYAEPAQLGADRWAALIGAWRAHRTAALVINAGTTMTVDALSRDGVFLGGVIVPGLELMRASLDRGTAQLRLHAGKHVRFPDNTADAIMSGAVNALAGAIERMRGYLTEAGAANPLIILSGGAAPSLLAPVQEGLSSISARAPAWVLTVDNLVLDGLLEIARETA